MPFWKKGSYFQSSGTLLTALYYITSQELYYLYESSLHNRYPFLYVLAWFSLNHFRVSRSVGPEARRLFDSLSGYWAEQLPSMNSRQAILCYDQGNLLLLASAEEVIESVLSVCLCIWVCESYVAYHFDDTGLCYERV